MTTTTTLSITKAAAAIIPTEAIVATNLLHLQAILSKLQLLFPPVSCRQRSAEFSNASGFRQNLLWCWELLHSFCGHSLSSSAGSTSCATLHLLPMAIDSSFCSQSSLSSRHDDNSERKPLPPWEFCFTLHVSSWTSSGIWTRWRLAFSRGE